jgi:hypothetical protein
VQLLLCISVDTRFHQGKKIPKICYILDSSLGVIFLSVSGQPFITFVNTLIQNIREW